MRKIYFFRAGVDFSKVNPKTMREVVKIGGKEYETFGNRDYTALIPVGKGDSTIKHRGK